MAMLDKVSAVASSGAERNFFDLSEETLRSRSNAKWNSYGAGILPCFVAEMDFQVADPIQKAITRFTDKRDYGYPQYNGAKAERAVAEAFATRMEKRFGWRTDPGLVQVIADLVQGTFAPILAFSEPGDGVILQLPAYPPFRESIASTERKQITQVSPDFSQPWVPVPLLEELSPTRSSPIRLTASPF